MERVMTGQSTENMEYVRTLLKRKQPGFSAAGPELGKTQ
jgi:hypothetical protein